MAKGKGRKVLKWKPLTTSSPATQEEEGASSSGTQHATYLPPQPQDRFTIQRPQTTSMASMEGSESVRHSHQLPDLHTQQPQSQNINKKGSVGEPIELNANYYAFKTPQNFQLYMYKVFFYPAEKITREKKNMFRTACHKLFDKYIFDGATAFASRRLSQLVTKLNVVGYSGRHFTITINFVRKLNPGELEFAKFFNLLMRQCLQNMDLQQIGRCFYDEHDQSRLSNTEKYLCPGFLMSARKHEESLFYCWRVINKLISRMNVLDLIHQYRGDNFRQRATKDISGTVVLTSYNNRTQQVDSIDWSKTPLSQLYCEDGRSISYVQFFRERFQVDVHYMNQPLLVSHSKPRDIRTGMPEILYLVPELCRMTGLTDQEHRNSKLIRQMLNHTCLSPSVCIGRLNYFHSRFDKNTKITRRLKSWQINLSSEMINLQGRVLPPEQIIYGKDGKNQFPSNETGIWIQNLLSKEMLRVATVRRWVIITPNAMKNEAQDFSQKLQKAAGDMSFMLPEPYYEFVGRDYIRNYLNAIDNAMLYNPQFILFCVPYKKIERYRAIKRKTCVDRPIITEVISRKVMLARNVTEVAARVAIQINCKLGGAPWTVPIPFESLMVAGFDVSRDLKNKSPSYGALIASLDTQCTRYFSTVTLHPKSEELSKDIAPNMVKAVKKWQALNNGNLPEAIVIYRDGVSESQLPLVYMHEVEKIRSKLQELYKEKPLKMAFIVVTKRINTRFFAGYQNPPSGTVVDSVITLPDRSEFFMVSQIPNRGTVSPTCYIGSYNTLGVTSDELQRLTYSMTHMYYNYAGRISIPAPCQYAHKLAHFLTRTLQRAPSPKLENLLYFL